MKQICIVLTFLCFCTLAFGQLSQLTDTIQVASQGQHPESVLIDRPRGQIYVSMHNNWTGATDGIIAIYDLHTYAWKETLDGGGTVLKDPMGMALIGNYLYVTNSDMSGTTGGSIVRINLLTGVCTPAVTLPVGSNYFDLDTDGVELWASSGLLAGGTGKLYHFTDLDNWPNPSQSSSDLVTNASGNGVLLGANADVWIADYSGGTHAGYVQSYDRESGALGELWDFSTLGAKTMDGLAWEGTAGESDLYTTDWGANVYMRSSDGTYSIIITGFTSAADIWIDQLAQRLYVVDMMKNEIKIYRENLGGDGTEDCGALGAEFVLIWGLLYLLRWKQKK